MPREDFYKTGAAVGLGESAGEGENYIHFARPTTPRHSSPLDTVFSLYVSYKKQEDSSGVVCGVVLGADSVVLCDGQTARLSGVLIGKAAADRRWRRLCERVDAAIAALDRWVA